MFKKSIKVFILVFVAIIPFNIFCYHSVQLKDGKILSIAGYLTQKKLIKTTTTNDLDLSFGKGGIVDIPLAGDPNDFKIYHDINTNNIIVMDKKTLDTILFNENGTLLKNSQEIKKEIEANKKKQEDQTLIEDLESFTLEPSVYQLPQSSRSLFILGEQHNNPIDQATLNSMFQRFAQRRNDD